MLRIADKIKEYIGKFRNQCKNSELRHVYLRIFSKDFLTMEKMIKYKWSMTVNVRDVVN
jgi:hypothetical protein